MLDVREHWAKQIKPLAHTSFRLLPMRHWAFPGECPESDLWMNLKCPPLAVRRDRIVHLFDLRRDAPCLLAQPPRRLLPIDRACLCIGALCISASPGESIFISRLTGYALLQAPGGLHQRADTWTGAWRNRSSPSRHPQRAWRRVRHRTAS